jgi:hypothetical protein
MRLLAVSVAALLALAPLGVGAQEQPASSTEQTAEPEPEPKSFGHRLLLYLPNRVFDVLDLVRLRVRAGPGWTFGLRVTELADINLGGHATVFAGLHGPRSRPEIPWPVGLETFAGVELIVGGGTEEEEHGPQYGPLEIGFGGQFLLVGADIGIEPYDALDLVLGLVMIDIKGDDL